MKQSKSKAVYTIVFIFGILAIIFMVLKVTGTFDVMQLFKETSNNSSNKTVIGEFESEPFGDLDVTLNFTAYDDGYIYIRLNSASENFDDDSFSWFYKDSGEIDISEISYDSDSASLLTGGHNTETGMLYTGFAIPLDCEKILLDGNEITPQNGVINTTVGKKKFKFCTLTFYDDDQDNHEFILIDKEGKQHLIED